LPQPDAPIEGNFRELPAFGDGHAGDGGIDGGDDNPKRTDHVGRRRQDHETGRRLAVRLDGSRTAFIRVEFFVGKHGPFVERFEKETFTADVRDAKLCAFADQVRTT
jgi:hypothetical protein